MTFIFLHYLSTHRVFVGLYVYRWAEGFMGWGHSCRLRHVTSGRYLAATPDNQVVTLHRSAATEEATAFVVRESKVQYVPTAS